METQLVCLQSYVIWEHLWRVFQWIHSCGTAHIFTDWFSLSPSYTQMSRCVCWCWCWYRFSFMKYFAQLLALTHSHSPSDSVHSIEMKIPIHFTHSTNTVYNGIIWVNPVWMDAIHRSVRIILSRMYTITWTFRWNFAFFSLALWSRTHGHMLASFKVYKSRILTTYICAMYTRTRRHTITHIVVALVPRFRFDSMLKKFL